MSEVITGEVKWFSNERGYGFVTPIDKNGVVDTSNEYFVHFSNIVMEGYKTLSVEDIVTFEVGSTDKGLQAINVKLAM